MAMEVTYIPKLMCTQHPDSTVKITAQQEVDEAIQGYMMYGCDEVMSDYEGKLTPYAQPKDIVLKAYELGVPIGEKFFVTPRIPNPSLEDFDRVDLSIEAGIIANYYSFKILGIQVVRWFILPMVESTDIVRLVQRLIIRKTAIISEELNTRIDLAQLIPLIEDSHRQLMIHDYVFLLVNVLKEFNVEVPVLRVFLGKSDAAVKSGHIASALSILYALSELNRLSGELGVRIEPIIGMGVPPFRGALNNPELVEFIVERYRGFRTATIQSAVRYDIAYPEYLKVRNAILSSIEMKPANMDIDVVKLVDRATKAYRELVIRYIDVVQKIACVIPGTRDRISWRSYGRILPSIGETLSIPRAIVYTSTWYTIGLPPIYLDADFIIELYREDKIDEVLKIIPHLEKEWRYDARFYVPHVALNRLGEDIVKKVNEALDIMGIKPEPLPTYVSLIESNPAEPHIIALGRIRGFLG